MPNHTYIRVLPIHPIITKTYSVQHSCRAQISVVEKPRVRRPDDAAAELRPKSYKPEELRLLERYWEHPLFRVCRVLGLLFAVLALAAIGTAIGVDRWQNVSIRPPVSLGDQTAGPASAHSGSTHSPQESISTDLQVHELPSRPQVASKNAEALCWERLFNKMITCTSVIPSDSRKNLSIAQAGGT